MNVPILAYHKVSDRFEWSINSVSPRAFKSQIQFLVDHHFYTISLEQYFDSSIEVGPTRRPIIITFDDSDESVLLHAFPIMQAAGFQATLFIVSGYVGHWNRWDANLGGIYSRHLSWDQIKLLVQAGWEVGSHTVSHPDLVSLSNKELQNELKGSREVIESKLNQRVRFISYPFNRFDRRVIDVAQQAGYCGACALWVSQRWNDLPWQFRVPRLGVYRIDSLSWFKKKLAASWMERFKQRLISLASHGTIWYKRLHR
ncbi:MAG: polysaccharide deacetylase family protein [candidate division KSB1 bacterium]|nr:polysaccharide deacetylase family protein [candidate division KSB1 bacterium]MDZ7357413.1 polysaccharide deacetylase family protein [candidate division KSB1 bacterium]MDZ7401689.1 polysaccharide deacetylase family protein [candidate division KSB1 bacterium]